MNPQPPLSEKAANTILDWITKYGIATVFAVILLIFVLWSQIQLQQQVVHSISEISRIQADQTRALVEITKTLDRIQARLDREGK